MTLPEEQHFIVAGEAWVASPDPAQPGRWDFTWVSGPNPGYGFTSRSSDGQWHPERREFRERCIRQFLANIDPRTGYLSE